MKPLESSDLRIYLKRFSLRLRLRDGLSLAQRTLWALALALLTIQVAGRLWPLENVWVLSIAVLLTYTLSVLVFSIIRPQTLLKVARQVDMELVLKERLSTAVVLGSNTRSQFSANFQSELVERQNHDALRTAAAIDPRQAFNLHWYWRALLLAALLAISAGTLAFIPNPMDVIRAERAAIAKAAEAEADRIEELRQEVAAFDELSAEDREELLRLLQELAEALRQNRGDRAEALAEISKVEDALRQHLDSTAGLRQATLDALAAQMQSLAGMQTSEKADLSESAEALEKLAEQISEMTTTEQQSLSQTLAQMAAHASQAGETGLAQALAEMALAAASGDTQAAQEAAQQAGEAMVNSQADLSNQANLEQTLSQLRGSRQAISQAGQSQALADAGQGQADGQGNNQENGDSDGQGQGQGQGDGQGQPGGGGGTDADTLPPGTGSGQAGDPTGQGRPSAISGQEPQLYTPWERRQGVGDPFYIPGQDTGDGETQVRERYDPFPGSPGQALVPYHEVFYTYMDAANQAIEQSYIPNSLKDFVREYFSQLEP
jgi:hypothetical protein